ncbi:nucleolar and coiled-body phosphoprotein [Reticulomyxa filosa]|uniref:Nucleolar and coiled-body phosphoprotein n=1 Tax=Reticulomyxa filosa TaxID=46433 RepID=X6M449_RETFI|nr:nucleolar and coiled-body phosphoprotein [Reticulomyxa filosa]|eukprot:ETO08709.1 nucleolar and coiled-body phosphoprotein [Reticulomyxa filosa]
MTVQAAIFLHVRAYAAESNNANVVESVRAQISQKSTATTNMRVYTQKNTHSLAISKPELMTQVTKQKKQTFVMSNGEKLFAYYKDSNKLEVIQNISKAPIIHLWNSSNHVFFLRIPDEVYFYLFIYLFIYETRQTLLNPYCTLYRVRMGHHKPHIEILFAFQLDNDIGHHHQSYYFESLQQLLFVEYATMAHGGCLMQLCVAHPSIFEQMYQEKQQSFRQRHTQARKDDRPSRKKSSQSFDEPHDDHVNVSSASKSKGNGNGNVVSKVDTPTKGKHKDKDKTKEKEKEKKENINKANTLKKTTTKNSSLNGKDNENDKEDKAFGQLQVQSLTQKKNQHSTPLPAKKKPTTSTPSATRSVTKSALAKSKTMRSTDKDNDRDTGVKKRPKTSKGSTNGSKSHDDHPNAKTPRGERTNTSAAASLSKKPKTTRSTRSTKTAVVETTTTTKRPNLEMQVTKTVVSSETTSASSEGDSNHSEEEKMASPKTSGLEKLKQSNSAKQKKGLHQEFLEEVIDQLLEDIPSSEDEKTFAYNNCNTNNVVSKNAITATAKTAAVFDDAAKNNSQLASDNVPRKLASIRRLVEKTNGLDLAQMRQQKKKKKKRAKTKLQGEGEGEGDAASDSDSSTSSSSNKDNKARKKHKNGQSKEQIPLFRAGSSSDVLKAVKEDQETSPAVVSKKNDTKTTSNGDSCLANKPPKIEPLSLSGKILPSISTKMALGHYVQPRQSIQPFRHCGHRCNIDAVQI